MPAKRKARHRLPRNAVYDAIQAAGGPTKVVQELGVSAPTLSRWRREGAIPGDALLRLAEMAGIPVDPRLKRLAGLGKE